MNSIIKSIYGLVAHNDGKYKSDRQKAFLLKVTQGVLVQNFNVSLGQDYNNKTITTAAHRVFTLDGDGIVSIIHNNAKGSEVIYCRAKGINKPKAKAQYNAKGHDLRNKMESLQQTIRDAAIDEFKAIIEEKGLCNSMLEAMASKKIDHDFIIDFINNPLFSGSIHELGREYILVRHELETM